MNKKAVSKPTQAPVVSHDLAEKLQESIAKIEKKADNCRVDDCFDLPEKIVLIGENPAEPSFMGSAQECLLSVKEELMAHLHTALHLPEYGEVKLQLQLSEYGTVLSIKILTAASQKNREYLEKELPQLSFSSIALNKLSDKERTFIISFHNKT